MSAVESAAGTISAGAAAAQNARRKKMSSAMNSFGQHIGQDPMLLQRLLSKIFRMVVFENCQRQSSMSRPLLPLILLESAFYSNFVDQLISSAAGTQQQVLRDSMSKLMEGITGDLGGPNKERFTQNLYKVIKQLK